MEANSIQVGQGVVMKIRLNFVSNSSSSSYVIVVPDHFSIKKVTSEEIDKFYWESRKYILDDGLLDYDRIRKGLMYAIAQGDLWHEDNYELFDFAVELLRKYSISRFDTGPDCGKISFVKQSVLEQQLKEFNRENE